MIDWLIDWLIDYNTIKGHDTTHFNSGNDYCTGCQNVSHCQQQQSYSGLLSPGQSNSTYFWNDSSVQTFHSINSIAIITCITLEHIEKINTAKIDQKQSQQSSKDSLQVDSSLYFSSIKYTIKRSWLEITKIVPFELSNIVKDKKGNFNKVFWSVEINGTIAKG